MSFYNGILNHDDIHGSAQIGPRGLPGNGFIVDSYGNYDIENKKLTNVKNGDMDHDVMVKSQIEGYVSNKTQYLDGALPAQVTKNKAVIYSPSGGVHTNDLYLKDQYGQEVHVHTEDQDLNQCRLYLPNLKNNDSYGGRKKSSIMITSIDQTIQGKKIFHDIEVPIPTLDNQGSNKKYVDNKVNSKADTSDLDDYLKLDGTKAMTGNINMNNNRIVRLPDPQLADEPVTRKFLTQTNTLFYNIFLDLDGNAQMRGNIKMNDHRITGLTNPPNADDEATNKKYVNDVISKANIKPSHTPKNVFQYLMNDVNEWSSEYNVKVENFSNLAESPHSWDKRVLNITPVKNGRNYRFRLGLQMFPMKNNETYSLIVELYNRDYKTWQRQETFIEGSGIWLKSHNTTKFQHRYGSSGDLYYTKTLIKFKKTSSSAPIFVYFTIHFDDKGGDMNTYPKDFKNQVYIIAYGIVGETDHVDSEVYDAHEAFEIDKTKMKMLMPLVMNKNAITNIKTPVNDSDAVNKGYVDQSINPLKNAFDIDNSRIKISKRLDMNNKSINNVSNLSGGGFISIYGTVHQSKYFTTSNIALNFRQIKIGYIRIHGTRNTRNKSDILKITDRSLNETMYPFRFPRGGGMVHISIDRYFVVVNSIQLTNTTNVAFQIGYSLFY